MRCGSFAECTNRSPSRSAMTRAFATASSNFAPSSAISAPKPRMAATFPGFASAGTQMTARTPNSRAA
jgi:hypothetical protein